MALFVLFFALVLSVPGKAEELPGLVRVKAKVRDEATGLDITREGTGTILQKSGRYYVLTAAHVSLGRQPVLTSKGEQLKIIGRAIDPVSDVDWFEIDKPETARQLINWNERYHSFTLEKFVEVKNTRDLFAADCRWIQSSANPGARCEAALFTPPAIVPMAEGVSTPVVIVSTSHRRVLAEASPYLEAMTGRVVLPIGIRKGESGAPLFWRRRQGDSPAFWSLVGIAQSFDLSFPYSYYGVNFQPGFKKVNEKEYEASFPMKATWRLRNGLTFLDFGDGIKEISMARSNAGTGGLTDDGGTGGLTDDGGTGDSFVHKKIQPGIEVDGASCIAFREKPGTSYFADRSVVEALYKGKIERASCVETGKELQETLLERLSIFADRKVTAGMEVAQNGGARVEILEDGIAVRLPIYTIEGIKLGWLSFSLDKKGGYQGQSFRPVIRVPGLRSGEFYKVDLRGLYFTLIGGGPMLVQKNVKAQPIFIQAMVAGLKTTEPLIQQFLFEDPRSIQLRRSPAD